MEKSEAFWVRIIRARLTEEGIQIISGSRKTTRYPDIIVDDGDHITGIEIRTGREANANVIPSGTVDRLNSVKRILRVEKPDREVKAVLITDLDVPSYPAELAEEENHIIIKANESEAAAESLIQHILDTNE